MKFIFDLNKWALHCKPNECGNGWNVYRRKFLFIYKCVLCNVGIDEAVNRIKKGDKE